MKKFNWIIAGVMAAYLVAAMVLCCFVIEREKSLNKEYKVEINRVLYAMEKAGGFSESKTTVESGENDFPQIEFQGMNYLTTAEFLSAESAGTPELVKQFYQSVAQPESNFEIQPLMIEDTLIGYVRFDYHYVVSNGNIGASLVLFFKIGRAHV